MSEKRPPQTDVAVLLLFFNRPETFRQVFDAVRQSRPSRLFLYQDGARDERDQASIAACRAIVADEEIDWQCDVRRNYQERNLGCETAGYSAHRWAFSMADKCVVLEDDVVPSPTFIAFCKEALDRYADDERITMISGFNMDETTPDVPYDYFFTSAFSIWGWASWRRVVEQWDADYSFLDDSYNLRLLEALIKRNHYSSDIVRMARDRRAQGKPFFESVFWTCMLFNSGLAVMPTRNMVRNVGCTSNSTNYSDFQTMPRAVKRLFTMQSYDVALPLSHPRYVIEDVGYVERMYRYNAWGHPWIKVGRSLEELWLNLRYGNFRNIKTAIWRRLKKWSGKSTRH